MEEGQAQGEEPVRRSQGGSIGVIGGGVDLLYNHDHDHGHVSPPDLPSPDQNQNRLMEDSEEVEHSPRGRRQLKQDSVNNNGSCEEEEEEAEVEEEEDSSKVEDKEVEEEEEEGDSISGAFSSDLDSRIRDSPSYSPTGVEDLVSSPEECVLGGVEDHAEADALRLRGGWLPCSPPAAAVLELGEHCDHALLPQRLHQEVGELEVHAQKKCIAEALVLEEDYERAIRFIQLERLYHERLLANLAALQEQWECRWRGDGGAQSLTVERTPIDPEQLERLSHICRTHRQPALRAEQSEAVDKVQKNSLICRSPRAKEEEEEKEEEKERERAVLLPCDTGSVADSARVTMEKQETSPQHDSTAASTSLSQQRAPESSQSHPAPVPAPTPPPHLPIETLTGSSGLTDSPSSNGCASEGGTEAGPSAAEAALAGETRRDGRPAEDFPEAPAVTDVVSHSPSREGPGEERQETLPPQAHTPPGQHMEPTHTAHTPDGLLSHTTAGTHTQQKAGAKVRPSQPEERTAGDGEEDEELEEEEEEVEEGEEALELDEEEEGGGGGGAVDDGGPVGLEVPEETPGVEEEREQNQELGVEPVEPVGPVKVATLDDMAKRIKVEEIAPASGLVSILKRRASLEEANSSRAAPNPKALTKRKVRFREPDDGFDQDEVGGDSWALLLLLCLATVVISVGGTALYCTVGDAQSSVCTDFSHNMDFYVQQVQRGMAELKHWFSPSS